MAEQDFAEFVSSGWPRLCRTAYLLTRDRVSAHDLLEKTLIRGWATSPQITQDLEQHLRRVMVKLYLARWRVRRRTKSTDWTAHTNDAERTSPASVAAELWGAFGRLARLRRMVLVLRYGEDLPADQAAELMGIPSDTAESLTSEALAQLVAIHRENPRTVDAPPELTLDERGRAELSDEVAQLRRLLSERGADATRTPIAPYEMFTSRGHRRRRRTLVLGAVAAAAVGALLSGTTVAVTRTRNGGSGYGYALFSSSLVRPGAPLPAYADGKKLLAHLTLPTGQAQAGTSFTPNGWGLSIDADAACPTNLTGKGTVTVTVYINDHHSEDLTCTSDGSTGGSGLAIDRSGQAPVWQIYGVTLGQPASLSVRVSTSRGAHVTTAIGPIGVYQQVPRADYPVPTAPPLLLPDSDSVTAVLDSRHVGMNGTWTITATIGDQMDVVAAAPGSVTVDYAGHQLTDVERYDYTLHSEPVFLDPYLSGCSCSPVLKEGQHIQLTIHASSFTDAGWYIDETPN